MGRHESFIVPAEPHGAQSLPSGISSTAHNHATPRLSVCKDDPMERARRRPLDVRNRIADSASSLFAHVAYPLANSLDYPGDPGLFGPDSATWAIIGDAAAFVGGIRALLIQAAHPEVVAGVADHSSYEDDTLGRLSRTSAYVAATAYGAMPEVDAALKRVRRAHRRVKGTSHRGRAYSASDGSGAAWVHNVLVDSFLTAFAVFGPGTLTRERGDLFAREQAALGKILGAPELPTTRDDLAMWIDSHPDIEVSPGMEAAVSFLRNPPLPRPAAAPYRILYNAAVATLPPRVASMLDVRSPPGALAAGRLLVAGLRWSLGSSPSWWLALQRIGADAPPRIHFRRPPPVEGIEEIFTPS